MITPDFVRLMARYNQWQNRSLYAAADALDETARRADRGAFFSSIHGTLSHLAWGDANWLHRFDGFPRSTASIAESGEAHPDWAALKAARALLDAAILDWSARVDPHWLADDMTWRLSSMKREITAPRGPVVAHFFNHQTHHRGQVHAMLTAAGVRPDATDLVLMVIDR